MYHNIVVAKNSHVSEDTPMRENSGTDFSPTTKMLHQFLEVRS